MSVKRAYCLSSAAERHPKVRGKGLRLGATSKSGVVIYLEFEVTKNRARGRPVHERSIMIDINPRQTVRTCRQKLSGLYFFTKCGVPDLLLITTEFMNPTADLPV